MRRAECPGNDEIYTSGTGCALPGVSGDVLEQAVTPSCFITPTDP
jgi:hypothetical protein